MRDIHRARENPIAHARTYVLLITRADVLNTVTMESSVPDLIEPSCEPSSEITIPDPFDEFLLGNADECADVQSEEDGNR